MILLQKESENIYYKQGENFTIYTLDAYSTTKPKQDDSLLYYEGTCYYGNGYALFGFTTNNGRVALYPYENMSQPLIAIQGNLRTDLSQAQQLVHIPFPIEFPYTAGIGINPMKHKFTIFYNDKFFTIDLNQSYDIRRISPFIWGSSKNETNETVSINFGYFPFKYSVYGLIPWESEVRITTSCLKNHIHISSFLIYIFILF